MVNQERLSEYVDQALFGLRCPVDFCVSKTKCQTQGLGQRQRQLLAQDYYQLEPELSAFLFKEGREWWWLSSLLRYVLEVGNSFLPPLCLTELKQKVILDPTTSEPGTLRLIEYLNRSAKPVNYGNIVLLRRP